MKVSVIIPVYKAEDYLRECVDSVLAQTMSDLEIILVNDGSPDRSGEIMTEYEARYPDKIRTITLENGGQGRARNFGIDIARGDFLSFIDSDDYIEPETYALMLEAAEREQADIVICDMEKRYDDGRREYVHAALQDDPLAAAGSSSNKIFRRSLVGDIRFPVGLWYEDFAFSAKLMMISRKTVFVEKPLYIYRCGQTSTMNNNNARKNLDIIAIMEEIRTFSENGGYRDGFEFLLINHVLLDSIKRLAVQQTPDRSEVIRELREYVHRNIPDLTACQSYRRETRNRKLIMWLNYHALERLSVAMLKIKGSI
jgi:glycosyltransferase involved in cell wall biosynthesis